MCLGIPGQIVEVTDAESRLAVVNVGGVKRTVNIAFVVDEEEAARTLALLQEMGEVQAELDAMRDSA